MIIKKLEYDLAICQLKGEAKINFNKKFYSLVKTEEELSFVCPADDIPTNTINVDKGWNAFYIKGVLDFSMVGILAKLSNILAENQISIFAISTYNTDYILVKNENFNRALSILEKAGYIVE